MSASAGDFVTPGTSIVVDEGLTLGEGVISTESGVLASLSGELVEDNGVVSVQISGSTANLPKIGDVVIGQVNRLNSKTAEIRILHIEDKEGGDRTIPALKLFADIYVTDFVDRYIPSAGDAMRSRDIVRAKITQFEPMLKASTRADPELGVLHAICPPCGEELEKSNLVPDFNVSCPRCDYSGYRVLSNGFGHGYTIPEGSDVESLNRPGERWSAEAEKVLGHDGVRPYLSPLADFRRGLNHEIPASAAKMRNSNRSGGNRSGGNRSGGQRREMHKTTCTMCSSATEVPFKPTPGKPIRCRDCMNKVNDGKATKEELSAEREVLKSARAKSAKHSGVKLFVGSISWDANEDDLQKLFSTYGELTEVHIAKDRETGKSRGFAFIKFSSLKAGQKAVKELDGFEFHGRKISVQESNESRGGSNERRPRRRK
ncbi:MAG: exosome complex RNA-binding protein Csl4 [Candidatus Poseidoniales archaeon]|jgi:cold-inducible RNA-binding protein|nr:exosome complex RNA-binding protein Csl4 [Candidatus Poseidoniales archaeon]|tara:strand:+ start:9959 stop:11248 length:1290 start_codon:yes stop_codon:yes gene_type:complete